MKYALKDPTLLRRVISLGLFVAIGVKILVTLLDAAYPHAR